MCYINQIVDIDIARAPLLLSVVIEYEPTLCQMGIVKLNSSRRTQVFE